NENKFQAIHCELGTLAVGRDGPTLCWKPHSEVAFGEPTVFTVFTRDLPVECVCTGASMTLATVFGPRCSSVPPEHRSAIEMKELSRIVTVSAGHYPIRSSQPL